MASITIRKLEDEVKTKLRIRAAENGQSMEEEARQILRSTLDQKPISLEQSTEKVLLDLSLEERLIKLEKQGKWISAKDSDTRLTVGKPAPGALQRFLADR